MEEKVKSDKAKFSGRGNVKLKQFSFSKLFPNIVTISAICCGLSSIRYALDSKWEISVMLILIAGFLDVIDGRLARFLKATSDFGAYLDSLADFIDFGVAPAIVIYLWNLNNIPIKGLGWALVLFFSVCMAIRLARFTSELYQDSDDDLKHSFFKGVPAPAGAYLAIMPMMIEFCYEVDFSSYLIYLSIYIVAIGLLLVSSIPTFSTKKITIDRKYVPLFLVVFGLLITLTLMMPWVILPIIGILYIISIFYSAYLFRKKMSVI